MTKEYVVTATIKLVVDADSLFDARQKARRTLEAGETPQIHSVYVQYAHTNDYLFQI